MDEGQIPETLRKKKRNECWLIGLIQGKGTELHINGTIERGMVT
jgi:hypothetical protein